ncbi:Ankyrin repeat protein 1 [Giardia muris]|uniref:Ankyrin repeat protein 1 n=1 Tax=Giardia muris TaxID=5742 RepID=A0A4Z1SP49_GIAMU|nr:Ankyrin repeat protein 1 [Giardia muris]|eukprot:TNJ27576.1 Ankyrin repeat protein 1 [Giardia muris]
MSIGPVDSFDLVLESYLLPDSSGGEESLFTAVLRCQSSEELQELLSQADLSVRTTNQVLQGRVVPPQSTLLMWLLYARRQGLARALSAEHFNAMAGCQNSMGVTALMLAAELGDQELVSRLLPMEAGYQTHREDYFLPSGTKPTEWTEGRTALIYALQHRQLETALLLAPYEAGLFYRHEHLTRGVDRRKLYVVTYEWASSFLRTLWAAYGSSGEDDRPHDVPLAIATDNTPELGLSMVCETWHPAKSLVGSGTLTYSLGTSRVSQPVITPNQRSPLLSQNSSPYIPPSPSGLCELLKKLEGLLEEERWFIAALTGDLETICDHLKQNIGKKNAAGQTATMLACYCDHGDVLIEIIREEARQGVTEGRREVDMRDVHGNASLHYAIAFRAMDCLTILSAYDLLPVEPDTTETPIRPNNPCPDRGRCLTSFEYAERKGFLAARPYLVNVGYWL